MTYQPFPVLTAAVFPSFKKWPSHEQVLKSLVPEVTWNIADTREDTFTKLQSIDPHLVYFYCHGGIEEDTPYLKVGAENERGITPDNLLSSDIYWKSPQPLVFLNGCRTTALETRLVLDFVTSFVRTNHAAGVIGTEIAIFEALACAFAEECLRRFLVESQTIGDAARGARLKLLKQGNPLGLIYTVYANASLRLKKVGGSVTSSSQNKA
jgi:CHAT domain-containing protein